VPLTTEGDAVRLAVARWRVAPDAVRAAFEQAYWLLSDGPGESEESFGWIGSREKLIALRPEMLLLRAFVCETSKPWSAAQAAG
jgi:hypothetical protein